MGLPLLPVTILNTNNILPPHSLNLLPGRATMIVHPKIDTVGYSDENIDKLMMKTRAAIQSGIDAHR